MKFRDRIRKWRQTRRERAASETWAEWQRKSARRDWIITCLILAITIGGIAFGLIRYPDTTGCPISFGLSLGCLVYSILNLVRIHRKRKAEARNHPLAHREPTYVVCDYCGSVVGREQIEKRQRQKQMQVQAAIRVAHLLEPMTPEEFQREMAKLEGKLDA